MSHVEWSVFKKRLNPQPNRRTARKWVERGLVAGNIVEDGKRYKVYIDEDAWNQRALDEETEGMLA